MAMQSPRPARILVRVALWAAAAFGLLLLGLVVAGAIRFASLDCGSRLEWTEANATACSDIDETNPILLAMGLAALLPLALALLIRLARRLSRMSGP